MYEQSDLPAAVTITGWRSSLPLDAGLTSTVTLVAPHEGFPYWEVTLSMEFLGDALSTEVRRFDTLTETAFLFARELPVFRGIIDDAGKWAQDNPSLLRE